MSAIVSLNIPLEAVRFEPINVILDLIDKLMPEEERHVERKKVTAEDIQKQKKVEYKIWRP